MNLPGYDAWKLMTPEEDRERWRSNFLWREPEYPEFECVECCDTGYAYPGELCEYCQQPMTLEDLEDVAADLDQARALQLTRR